MLTEKDYCNCKLTAELEQLGMPIKIDFVCGIENGQLVKTKFYPNRPSLYEAQKWLREEKHIDVLVYLDDLKGYLPLIRIWEGSWKTFINLEEMEEEKVSYSANYEEALAEGIKEAIKILKEK